jgi:hypothetical protein
MANGTAVAGGAHWSVHPRKLLAAVLGAALAAYLVKIAAGLAAMVVTGFAAFPAYYRPDLFRFTGLLSSAGLALLAAGFGWAVWKAQRKRGLAVPSPWKAGTSLWAGLALTAAYMGLAVYMNRGIPGIAVSMSATLGALAADCLTGMLFVGMLYPAFESRLGVLKGSLAICAAFALLAVLKQVLLALFGGAYGYAALRMTPGEFFGYSALENVVIACAVAFALAALRIALYLTASRRIPGAWLLYTAAYGFLLLLQIELDSLLTGVDFPYWMKDLCVVLPPHVLVFAVCLGVLAGFRRWKTREAFLADTRAIMRKARAARDDMYD